MVNIAQDPRLDPLRTRPEFQAILRADEISRRPCRARRA